MGREIVSLIVGGVAYTAWTSMSVKYSAQSGEITFQVNAADEAPDLLSSAFLFEPGTACELRSNGDLLVNGFITDLEISIDPNDHPLSVSGKSKGCDAHDCSVDHPKHEFEEKDVKQIANECGTNVSFTSDVTLEKIKKVRINPGEDCYKAIDKLARARGLILTGQKDGTIKITKAGQNRHSGAIVEGVNMVTGSAKFSDQKRHNKYKVKGQERDGTGKEKTQVEQEATDSGGRSGRTKVLIMDQNMPKNLAKSAAEQVKKRRQGESVKATVTTQGFRDQGGTIWEAGWVVFVQSVMLHLSDDLAIESVELKQDNDGSSSTLQLVDPRALGGEKGKGKSRSAGGYSKGL